MVDRPFVGTETLKLAGLDALDICYTPLDARFDRLTRLAREALGVSVAGITLAHDEKFWFKSVAGWDVQELPQEKSLCALPLAKNQVVIIDDTRIDPATASHPLVASAPNFRFYAGYPLCGREGGAIGTLCAYDIQPRHLSAGQLQAFRDLGELAQRELLTAQLHDAQKQLIAKLDVARRQAMIDPLTRVWTRRAGLELLASACEQATRHRYELAVCMVDLDQFKAINDQHGHPAGDQLLKKVAGIIVNSLRPLDTVVRYGGDEFIVVIERINQEELERLSQRIRDRVEEAPLKTRSGDIPVSVSIGTTLCKPGRASTPEELIDLADQALLGAKHRRYATPKGAAPRRA